jgi:hypothetical protein
MFGKVQRWHEAAIDCGHQLLGDPLVVYLDEPRMVSDEMLYVGVVALLSTLVASLSRLVYYLIEPSTANMSNIVFVACKGLTAGLQEESQFPGDAAGCECCCCR